MDDNILPRCIQHDSFICYIVYIYIYILYLLYIPINSNEWCGIDFIDSHIYTYSHDCIHECGKPNAMNHPQAITNFMGAMFTIVDHPQMLVFYVYDIGIYWDYVFWVNYNISPTWIKAIWGWFPLLTMIPVRENSGRYNLPRCIG